MAFPNRLLTLSSVGPESSSSSCTSSCLPSPETWLTGSSATIAQLRGQIRRVAPYFRTALLTGERGCGEEAVARILHQLSPLSDRPFLELRPAEAELRLGISSSPEEVITSGMIYLPQPERLLRSSQTALLRLLRERGASAPRIVAFAERGLRSLVSTGGFSAELADSLGALRISLPPLRERREDIPELLTLMLDELAAILGVAPPQLAPDLLETAKALPWNGNFIELRASAEGLLEQAAKVVLRSGDLQAILGAMPQAPPRDRREIRMVPLDHVIHEHIRAVLFACNGNKLRTAEVLGISRSTLYRMLETHAQPASASMHAGRLPMAG